MDNKIKLINQAKAGVQERICLTHPDWPRASDVPDHTRKALSLYEDLRAASPAHGALIDYRLALCHESIGQFDKAIAAFAEIYADQNERDYAALKEAAAQGRIVVESGL